MLGKSSCLTLGPTSPVHLGFFGALWRAMARLALPQRRLAYYSRFFNRGNSYSSTI